MTEKKEVKMRWYHFVSVLAAMIIAILIAAGVLSDIHDLTEFCEGQGYDTTYKALGDLFYTGCLKTEGNTYIERKARCFDGTCYWQEQAKQGKGGN